MQKCACVYSPQMMLANEVGRRIIQVKDSGKFFCPKLYMLIRCIKEFIGSKASGFDGRRRLPVQF